VSLFTNSLAGAVDEAIDFQREMLKIAQVLRVPVKELRGLQGTITNLSVGLGVVSKDLLQVTRVLSQAGVRGRDLEVALAALAKSTLAPTFDNIASTAEGAVAVLAQFKQGVGALEGQLSSINAVAGAFAVESGDLIGAVRRFGGVFKSAGGSLNELLAIFTSVRQTSRESAESISTGLRTIFTRIQRPETIRYLRELGVELQDVQGRFVGPAKAVEALGEAFADLPQGDLQFIDIAEKLGGFRQIGKVIPLIQQYKVTLEALKVAQEGQNSLSIDAAKAQQSLAVRITKVKEEFLALVRGIADSTSFQVFTRTALDLASALLKIVDALRPLLPLLSGLAAFKFAGGVGKFLGGAGASLRGVAGKNAGGKIHHFARGGSVPGSGNGDTVPAMLQPGEFVIKKSSASSIGSGTLNAMNNNKMAAGGGIAKEDRLGVISSDVFEDKKSRVAVTRADILKADRLEGKKRSAGAIEKTIQDEFKKRRAGLTKSGAIKSKKSLAEPEVLSVARSVMSDFPIEYNATVEGIDEGVEKPFKKAINDGIGNTIKGAIGAVGKSIGAKKIPDVSKVLDDKFYASYDKGSKGLFFENTISAFAGQPLQGSDDLQRPFDFVNGIGGNLGKAYESTKSHNYVEAKVSEDAAKKFKKFLPSKGAAQAADEVKEAEVRKATNDYINKTFAAPAGKPSTTGVNSIQAASGGAIGGGGDTVPALLTPGEFVVNKGAAKSIGYGNLNSMNKKGVARFAAGGAVGVQKFAGGGGVAGIGNSGLGEKLLIFGAAASVAQVGIQKLGDKSLDASDNMAAWTIGLEKGTSAAIGLVAIIFAIKAVRDWTKSLRESIKAQDQKGAKRVQTEAANVKKGEDAVAEGRASSIVGTELEVASGNETNSLKRSRIASKAKRIVRSKVAGGEGEVRDLQAEQGDIEDHTRRATAYRVDLEGQKGKVAGKQDAVAERIGKKQSELNDATTGVAPGPAPALAAADTSKKLGKELEDLGKTLKKLEAEALTLNNSLSEVDDKLDGLGKEAAENAGKLGAAQDKLTQRRERLVQVTANAATATENLDAAATRLGTVHAKAAVARNKEAEFQKTLIGRLRSGAVAAGEMATSVGKSAVGIGLWTAKLGTNDKNIKKVTGAMGRGFSWVGKKAKELERKALGLSTAFKAAGKAAKKLGEKVKNTGKRGFGAAKRGASKFGGAAASGLGVVAGLAAVGSQIASGFQEWFKRAEEQARASDDIAGAIDAAGKASIAQSIGQVFTIGGFIEAAMDPKGFVDKAAAKVETDEFNSAKSFIAPRQQNALDVFEQEGSADKEFAKVFEAQGSARSEAQDLQGGAREKALLGLNKQARSTIQSFDKAGVSINELRHAANQLGPVGSDLRDSLLKQVAAIEAGRIAQEQLNKANTSSLKITSAFGAASSAVSRFTAGLQTGGSSLDSYISVLESAQKNSGVDASGAVDAIERQLLGAGGGPLLGSEISRQADTARAATGFSQKALGAVSNVNLNTDNEEKSKSQLTDALVDAIPDGTSPEVRSQIESVISKNITSLKRGELKNGDISGIIDKIKSDSQQLSKGFFEAAKIQSAHNKNITKLYQNREKLEQKAAEALNKAIDTQLEAAKAFEDFGGAKLTGDQKQSARTAQFNNVGAAAGVGLRGGGASDIRRVAGELANVFNSQQQAVVQDIVDRSTRNIGGAGVFADASGVDADKRDEAKRASAALITFTKQRIALLKEELSIVTAKNREEKSALDKLISGDIEGFIKGQAAAGAGAALSSGSSSLAGLFSGSALGAGFKSLEGQGLSDQKKNKAAQLTLGNFGITDPNAAGVLSGTTGEANAIKAQGRETSRVLGDIAGAAAQMEVSEIAINEATIIASRLIFQKEIGRVTRENSGFVQNKFATGGMVYASKGMFVPRGTDTVPAMLTPGEFVINRAAVQRGNNLQMLRAMNSTGGASGPGHMSGGGPVRYYNTGGDVPPGGSMIDIPALSNAFSNFSSAVNRLADMQFHVKLDTTNVNVNFNGTSFLRFMKDDIKSELLEEVRREIGRAKPNLSNDLIPGKGTVLQT
jgi:uncharacterized coiled-coil DUF342 family protein